MTTVEIRDVGAADLEAVYQEKARAFGHMPPRHRRFSEQVSRDSIDGGRYLAAFDGGRLIAAAHFHVFRQWWRGRDVPAAGVSSVVVAPEYRGRGVSRPLLTALLHRAAEQGAALSVLYPATARPYRALGHEAAGHRYWYRLPAESLRAIAPGGDVALRRIAPGDQDASDAACAVLRRVHAAARHCGPLDWGEARNRLYFSDDRCFAYLADDGVLVYEWGGDGELRVDCAVAGSEATARALWRLVGSGSSTAPHVRLCAGPRDPVFHLTGEIAAQPDGAEPWMLGLIDAPAALTARGYPPLDAQVTLAVGDPDGSPAGTWLLTVSGAGTGVERVPATPAAPVFGARGLAAVYAGAPMATLRAAGLVHGGDVAGDPLIDAVFTAEPFCLEHF